MLICGQQASSSVKSHHQILGYLFLQLRKCAYSLFQDSLSNLHKWTYPLSLSSYLQKELGLWRSSVVTSQRQGKDQGIGAEGSLGPEHSKIPLASLQ